jgi:hypothetical protein
MTEFNASSCSFFNIASSNWYGKETNKMTIRELIDYFESVHNTSCTCKETDLDVCKSCSAGGVLNRVGAMLRREVNYVVRDNGNKT